eukprot:tig00000158_g10153.t1
MPAASRPPAHPWTYPNANFPSDGTNDTTSFTPNWWNNRAQNKGKGKNANTYVVTKPDTMLAFYQRVMSGPESCDGNDQPWDQGNSTIAATAPGLNDVRIGMGWNQMAICTCLQIPNDIAYNLPNKNLDHAWDHSVQRANNYQYVCHLQGSQIFYTKPVDPTPTPTP